MKSIGGGLYPAHVVFLGWKTQTGDTDTDSLQHSEFMLYNIYIYYTIMSLLSDNVFCNSPHDYRFCCHRNGIDLHGQTQTQKDLIRLFPQCACCMCKEQRTALTKQILIQIQFFLPDLVLGLIQTCVEQDLPTRIL